MKIHRQLVGIFLVASIVQVSAQNRLPMDLSVGWAPIFPSRFNDHILTGWDGSVGAGLNRFTSLAFDASGWYIGFSTLEGRHFASAHTFVGGPRVTTTLTNRMQGFAHMMAGTLVLADGGGNSQSGLVLQPGGGIDIGIRGYRQFAVRLQADYPNKLLRGDYGNHYWSRSWRISSGVAYRRRG
jgi:hypothetical protein